MITLLGIVARDPRTPLMLLFFIVMLSAAAAVAEAGVGGDAGAWMGYAIVLAYYAWWVIGWDKYYATPELRIPRSTEAIWI